MVLDDRAALAGSDPGGMLGLVGRFGAMAADGWRAAADLPLPGRRPSVVVVAGMGGSGIGGQLLRSLVAATSPVPVIQVAGPMLPAFVGPQTLVFVCSYSGDTEETLAAFDVARNRGAALLGLTSGGRLAERIHAGGGPLVMLPPGLPPRSSLPFQFLAMLRVAARLGLTELDDVGVDEATGLLVRLAGAWGPAAPSGENPAKQLARRLHGALPVIYAATQDTAPVAYRWKTQLNENAKVFAVWNAFPELSHNETVGWARIGEAGVRPHVVILRDREDGDRTGREIDATRDLALGSGHAVEEVWSQGDSRLARVLSLVLLGDFTSVYLACLAGIDPTPVTVIGEIKRRMQEASGARGTPIQ